MAELCKFSQCFVCSFWVFYKFYTIFRHEAMADLVYLLNSLTDKDGKILVQNMYEDVEPLTVEEEALYK